MVIRIEFIEKEKKVAGFLIGDLCQNNKSNPKILRILDKNRLIF